MYALIFIIQQMSIISVHLINHHKNNHVKWTIIKFYIEREGLMKNLNLFSLSVSVIFFIAEFVKRKSKISNLLSHLIVTILQKLKNIKQLHQS